jgi:hypothetical protein
MKYENTLYMMNLLREIMDRPRIGATELDVEKAIGVTRFPLKSY